MMKTLRSPLRAGVISLRTAGIVLCVLMSIRQVAAGADRAKLEHPVMMDSDGPGDELYVIVDGAVLHKLRVADNSLSEYGSVALPANFKPADMTFAHSEKPASILFAGAQSGKGKVILFSLENKLLREWEFQNVCSGVDFGEAGHTAYVATSDSNEIYKLGIHDTRISLVAHIDSAAKLGPVAFDEKHRRIYVADIAAGKIFLYSLESRTSKTFVTGLSAPSALAYDTESERLFVADPGQRSIFAVDTRKPNPAIARFASGPLRAPYGMTLISKGRVAVADYNANAVFVFSGNGDLLFRYPAAP